MSSPSLRTHTAGSLRAEHAGSTVILQGWAHLIRDNGGVLFLVLRDRSGICQVTADERTAPEVWEVLRQLRLEYVVEVEGTVQRRSGGVNKDMATGEIEVLPTRVVLLNRTRPLPFAIGGGGAEASEDVRLKNRYLDLRRPELQRNLLVRHKAALSVRSFMDARGFCEVETPVLTKSTPEGARDYLVPSRVHAGQWYALPQSPQIFKQLLMVAGMDRYFQIVKCFRDEDLRADRQPEFTQIDIEMSFATRDMVMQLGTELIRHVWMEVNKVEVGEIPVLSYHEAMGRFGVDAPDMRFGMEHQSLDWSGSAFGVVSSALAAGGICKAMVVKAGAEASRKTIDGWTDFVKRYKLSGLLWGKVAAGEGAPSWSGPLSKVEPELLAQLQGVDVGDLVLVAAGKPAAVHAGLGRLRVQIARERDLIPRGTYAFCWVTDFPSFEWDEDEHRWNAVHHPFTKPRDEDVHLMGTGREAEILADAYDVVCNGYEIGGGSIRIHDSEIQSKVFSTLGLSPEEAQQKFGFLLDALACGAPPHGGMAMGFDRWTMLLCGTENIRDVIAFPKTASAQDLMSGSPSPVEARQLRELFVQNVLPEGQKG
jgi:aspartyl-tRNA synthetase